MRSHPSLDDLTDTNLGLPEDLKFSAHEHDTEPTFFSYLERRLAVVGRIKLGPRKQGTVVVNSYSITRLGVILAISGRNRVDGDTHYDGYNRGEEKVVE